MQTKIKYNINLYKLKEETTQWEKVRNQKVIKVEPRIGLFGGRNDHWGDVQVVI